MQTLGLSDSTPKPEGRLRALLWPRITSDVAASTAAQNAMYAGFAVGGITTVLVLFRISPLTSLVDALLFVMLAAGARQFSVTASILALLLYVTNVGTSIAHGMIGSGIVVAIIVSSLFISSLRAALYMRHHPDLLQITNWSRIWKWTRPIVLGVCGIAFLLVIVSLFMPAGTMSKP
jgi:hypothetical protein